MESDSKKIIEALAKIVNNQQKIIRKLAQQQLPPDSLPTSQVGVSGDHPPAPASAPPAQSLQHNPTDKNPKGAIVEALGPFYQKSVYDLDVRGNDVLVRFKPGQATQPNYDHVLNTVKNLQTGNPPKLPGKTYQVKVV